MLSRPSRTSTSRSQRGNALFLILIAVALFAALSYAVTQSGRGGGTIDRETGTINASQITDYPAAVRTAVTRMILTGTTVSAVDFQQSNASVNNVFDTVTGGGGATWVTSAPASAQDTTAADADHAGPDWRFKSAPSTAVGGFFVMGVGTAAGRDSFAFVGVKDATCQAINRGLGLSTTATAETGGTIDFTSANEGTSTQDGGTTLVGDTQATAAITTIGKGATGNAFACISNHATDTTGPFIYYHALIEQ